jgi:CBS domain-containing protein
MSEMKLRDLMTHELLTLDPDMTLRDAVEQLSAAGVSGAPVVASGRLVGVFSASDVIDFQASSPGVPSHRSDRQETGQWGPADIEDEDLSEPASAWFRDMWEGSEADVLERMSDPEGPEWDVLSEHTVGELMTRQVVALPPDAAIADAARLMMGRGIHRLLVAEEDRLMGLVSATDFLRAVAEEKLQAPE